MSQIKDALSSRINTVNRNCDAIALKKISDFYSQIRIENGRFNVPSLKDVGITWIKLILEKQDAIIFEINQIINSSLPIEEADIDYLKVIIDEIFTESHYLENLVRFHEGVKRQSSRFGRAESLPRLDIHDAVYRAGIMNTIHTVKEKIFAELQIIIFQRSANMGFGSLLTDTVSVLKTTGQEFNNIKASVQSSKIFINRSDVLIESGDLVRRTMSNGGEETFTVIDPGFHEKFHSIPAGYQMSVRKLGLPEAKATMQNITYHLSGNNVRVNNNSVDNSTNNTQINSKVTEYLTQMRQIVEQNSNAAEKQAAIDVIDVVEQQFKTGKPSKPVVLALLATLPVISDIATIVAAIKDFL